MHPKNVILDSGLAVGLVVALVVVFLVGKPTPEQNKPDEQPAPVQVAKKDDKATKKPKEHDDGDLITLPEAKTALVPVELEATQPRALRLAVSQKRFDDVGAVLESLGTGFNATVLSDQEMEKPERLLDFDVVFYNCGIDATVPERVTMALREFVAKGRTLYASDLRFSLVSRAFPEVADTQVSGTTAGDLLAEVADPGLRERMGERTSLKFNLGGWQTARFKGEKVTVLLRSAEAKLGVEKDVPLLVKFPHKDGVVIFTSFHNSTIASDTAKKLLRFLVFSAVTAEVEAKMLKVLSKDRFSPTRSSLFDAPEAGWSEKRTIEREKPGTLRFAVGFNNQAGAQMKLTIEGPNGLSFQKEGTEPFVVDLRHAPKGKWTYTVTATKLPHPNFPLVVIAGEPSEG